MNKNNVFFVMIIKSYKNYYIFKKPVVLFKHGKHILLVCYFIQLLQIIP